MTYIALAVAVLVLIFWPSTKSESNVFSKKDEKKDEKNGPTFLQATMSLADVRQRLATTGTLQDDQLAAVDCLQLALNAGSDQK